MPVNREFDGKFREEGYTLIAGVDEAGRGPLAGPVVAAAVILPAELELEGLDDSKKVPEKRREYLYDKIMELSLAAEYTIVSNPVIDKINILNASLLAMKKSVEKLKITPDIILIDGNKKFKTNLEARAIIKGDAQSCSIAAASIVAKVVRDRIMLKYDKKFPLYHWAQNKGYATLQHREAIEIHGITKLHRRTFLKKYDQYELFR